MLKFFKKIFIYDKEKCFEEMKNKEEICYGMFDADKANNYLSPLCMNCKFHTPYIEK